MTDFNTPIYVPPPFQFGPLENAFSLEETFCHQNGVFRWLRANVGVKNRDWFVQVPGNKDSSFLGYLVTFRIVDPASEIQFRFTYADKEYKLMMNERGQLEHVRKK